MAAADTARLVAELTLSDKGFSSGLSAAQRKLGDMESTAFRVGQNIGKGVQNTVSNLAKIGAIGAGIGVGLLAKSVQEASDLNEQLSKATVVFGKASDEVIAFSKTTATSLGLAQSEALEAAGAFGNMFKTTGLAEDQAADMSQTMVTLAADMASFNNEDPSEMLDRLRSGLSGEAEPLRRFGVLLSEAAVLQEAYATGIAKSGEKLTEAQKVQARYSLILKQTAVQQGDFERTSGSLANQQRILVAQFKQTGATIGTALLPKITEIAVKLNKLIQDNQPAIIEFANKLPGAFDKAVAFAERIPWETIGRGMQTAAEWAGRLFDVFLSLPPEVQTTLVALAGLNKLSGGAITGIVSELGKGLIKGVLGMTAGVVNIKAGTVVGAGGGVPGAAPVGGGAKGGIAGAANLIMKVAIVGIAADVANTLKPVVTEAASAGHELIFQGPLEGLGNSLEDFGKSLNDLPWPFGPRNTPTILPEIFGGNGALGGTGVTPKDNAHLAGMDTKLGDLALRQNVTNERLESIRAEESKAAAALPPIRSEMIGVRQAVDAAKATQQSSDETIRQSVNAASNIAKGDSQSERTAIANAAIAQAAAVSKAEAASREAGRTAAAAIRDKDLSVAVNTTNIVNTTISARETIKTQTTYKNYQRFQS